MKTNRNGTRTPEEILDLIEARQKDIAEAIARLRAIKWPLGHGSQRS